MDKALEMAKVSATASLKLSWGLASSTVIMAVGTIILARRLTAGEYGLYSIALIQSVVFGLFRDLGKYRALALRRGEVTSDNFD